MRFISLIFVLLVMTGCGGNVIVGSIVQSPSIAGIGKTQFEMDNGTHYKIGNKYFIDGKAYYPREDYNYVEEGIASWYGPNFHAKPTANGGVFDMNKFTAAHRILPLPSVVRVTNLKNGRSMIVKVNDRGPYAKDRIIDLSRATANRLGIIKEGTAFVRVEVLKDESIKFKQAMVTKNSEPKLDHSLRYVDVAEMKKNKGNNFASGIYIQAGVFANYNNALNLANRVKSFGDKGKTKLHKINKIDGTTIYAVRIGPLQNSNKARQTLNNLLENNIEALIKLL
jgi:rare lipoprotein A